jgi:UDP-glucose 4-epimerase
MKKIIVFGSTGHLGAYTIDYLLDNIDKNEFEIIAVGRKNTDFYSNLGVDYFRVDVTDTKDLIYFPQMMFMP